MVTKSEQIRDLIRSYYHSKITDKRKRERFVDVWNTYTLLGYADELDKGDNIKAAKWKGFYGVVNINILKNLTIEECVLYLNYWCDKLSQFEGVYFLKGDDSIG